MGDAVNLGPCGCCSIPPDDDECRGWYCCSNSGEIFYVDNCDELAEAEPCADSIGREGICFNRAVPSIIYAEFGGAMASLGTVQYSWLGGPHGIGFYEWGNSEGTGTVVGAEFVDLHVCGQGYATYIYICGDLDEGQIGIGFGAPGGGFVCALRLDPTFTVVSWEPFETNTITGLMGHESQEGCMCYNQEFTIKLTGGPNDIDPDTLLSGPYETEDEALIACDSSDSDSDSSSDSGIGGDCIDGIPTTLYLTYSCENCPCLTTAFEPITGPVATGPATYTWGYTSNHCGSDASDYVYFTCILGDDGVTYLPGYWTFVHSSGFDTVVGTITSTSPLVVQFGQYVQQNCNDPGGPCTVTMTE